LTFAFSSPKSSFKNKAAGLKAGLSSPSTHRLPLCLENSFVILAKGNLSKQEQFSWI
jgi:hypothetical protein